MIWKALVVAMVVLASAACSGTQQALGESADADQEAPVRSSGSQGRGEGAEASREYRAVARAGDAAARAGASAAARTGDARARTQDAVTAVTSGGDSTARDTGGENRPGKATLKVTGDPGTAFSGACSVGEEPEAIEGRVPERYTYEPIGGALECEILNEGAGALKVVLAVGDEVFSVQETDGRGDTVRFAFSWSGASSSTSLNLTVESSGRSSSNDSP